MRASSSRSALTSGSSPGCTPPIPPVALTTMPAARRRPDRGAHGGGAQRSGRHGERVVAARDLRRDARLGEPRRAARRCSPTVTEPSTTPIHAGTAPARADRGAHPLDALEVARDAAVPDRSRSSRAPPTPVPVLERRPHLVGDRERRSSSGPPRPGVLAGGHERSGVARAARARPPAPPRARARRAAPRRTRRPPRSRRPRRRVPPATSTTDPSNDIAAPFAPSFTHATRIALAERARRGRRPTRPARTSASRSFARSTFAPAPVVSERNRPAPNASTSGHEDASTATNVAVAPIDRGEAGRRGRRPAGGGSRTPARRPASSDAGRSSGVRSAFAPRSATIERSPASTTTSIVPDGRVRASTVSAASTPRSASASRSRRPARSSPTPPVDADVGAVPRRPHRGVRGRPARAGAARARGRRPRV